MKYCPSCWQNAGTPPVKQSSQTIVECGVCGVKTICLECDVHLKPTPKWPQKIVVHLHSSKESMWEDGRKLGLSEAACEEFKYCCYEVGIEVEVNEDGSSKLIGLKEK